MNTNSDITTVTILGAGLTGLTIAYYLKQAGIKVIIIEKNNKPGGVIQSHSENGFTWESGPNTGVIGNHYVAELFEELEDLCTLEVACNTAKKRLILKNNKWSALPCGPGSGIKTPLFSLKDKFRILFEPFRKKGNNPMESLADMVKRRLGNSYLDYAVDPFISGVYAGNPEKLVTKYALPKLYNLEQNYGSFIKGAIKKSKEPKMPGEEKATKEVFSAAGGLSNLIKALHSKVGIKNVKLNSKIENINFDNNIYTINFKTDNESFALKTNYLITTFGGEELRNALNFIPPKDFDDIINLHYAKITQVILGYKHWKGIPLQAFGGLIPSKEKRKILGILFPSAFFKNRAPENGATLSIFMGGIKKPELINLSDEEITQIVLKEVNELMQTNNSTPDLIKIYRYKQAIPQYEASSGKRFDKISELENRYKGLIMGGNIRNGIGMADRIKQARDIAAHIIDN